MRLKVNLVRMEVDTVELAHPIIGHHVCISKRIQISYQECQLNRTKKNKTNNNGSCALSTPVRSRQPRRYRKRPPPLHFPFLRSVGQATEDSRWAQDRHATNENIGDGAWGVDPSVFESMPNQWRVPQSPHTKLGGAAAMAVVDF